MSEVLGAVPGLTVRSVGPHAALVEVADHWQALALARWVRRSSVDCADVVPAARTVLVDGLRTTQELLELLRSWPGPEALGPGDELVHVPVRYRGVDLERVARLWQVSPDEVIVRHTGLELVSAFCGFAPGFSYLAGLPPEWAVPRLDTPRPRVEPGSVALADTWCGIYPSASPGGWLLLGVTDLRVWDPSRAGHPCLLSPGTRVRFVAA